MSIVDQGIARPHSLDMPGSPAGSRFRQQCLRKMYVLCGRGVESQGPHSCQLKVMCRHPRGLVRTVSACLHDEIWNLHKEL